MGHEDPGLSDLHQRRGEAGRERDQVREQVAVGDAERQRVRRAVGEPREHDAGRVDRAAREDVPERAVDVLDVGPEATAQEVPRRRARLGHEQHQAVRLGDVGEQHHRHGGRRTGAVQQDDERARPPRGGDRHVQQPVASFGQAEGGASRGRRALGRGVRRAGSQA
jgi:hypothetical protein